MRQIKRYAGIRIERVLFYVGDDSDHREPRRVARSGARLESLADRIRARPIGVSHVLINDRDLQGIFRVRVAEESPADQRHFHRFEITYAGDSKVGLDRTLSRGRIIAFDGDRAPGDAAAQGKDRCAADGFDAGQPANALAELLIKS